MDKIEEIVKDGCGYYETSVRAAPGHNWDTAWTTDDNNHWHKCTRCTATNGTAAHSWGSGTVTTSPTCTATGVRTYTCSVCSKTKTATEPALGHNWATAWTTDDNNHWHKCTRCTATNGTAAHSDTSSPKNGLCNTCEYRMYYIATLASYPDKTYNAASQSISASTGYTLSGTTSATNVGTYTATATLLNHSDGKPYKWATDAATGTKTVTWKIVPYNLSNATIANISAYTYDTTAKKPTPTVTVPIPSGSTTTLTNGTHFTYSYSNNTNAGTTAKVTITAVANTNYTGSKSQTFTINQYDLSNATIGDISTYIYGGDEKKPTPTVKVPIPSGSTTTLNTTNDFTFSYSNNVNAGTTAKCTITGKGNYKGTNSKNFTINKATTAIAMNPGTTSVIKDTFGYSLGEAHAKVSYGASKSMTATVSTNSTRDNCPGTLTAVSDSPTLLTVASGSASQSVSATTSGASKTVSYNGVEADKSPVLITLTFTPTDTNNFVGSTNTFKVVVVDEVAPTGSIIIKSPIVVLSSGKKATKSQLVDLELTTIDAGSYIDKIAVFNENLKGSSTSATTNNISSSWIDEISHIEGWELSPNDGWKTVYLVIRDAWGNTTAIPTN